MAHTCTKCSRVNPDEAIYCYFDGIPLNGHGRAGGPIAIGAQPFPIPFVFPSGRTCRSFDELALGCQQEWDAARGLLQQGFLGSFFGGLGRADLALAADEARSFPDHDRGLDQLLAKLPTDTLDEPKLRANPATVSLGVLSIGEDRQFELHLENRGMRLLYGKVSVEDCHWLMLGDAPGAPQKLFQVFHEMAVPVHVVGKRLRANHKPQEGKLSIESNGGEPVTIAVRVEVPVKPYPGTSVLAGARSPRQVAEKAKEKAREAAVLFENGDVAAWYKSNGWTYPVQGPSASGLGAVQQFFEALGLTPPPRVQIRDREVTFQGNVRDSNLRHTLEIFTDEKKPIYAHGVSDQPWLEVSRAKLNGRVAQVTLTVPSVPDRPGETLKARVKIQSNGNQKFVVPVTLHIGHNLDFSAPEPVLAAILEPEPIEDAPANLPVAVAPAPVLEPAPAPILVPRVRRSQGKPKWAHAVPAVLLALALGTVVIIDLVRGGRKDERKVEAPPPPPPPPVVDTFRKEIENRKPTLGLEFTDEARFGVTLLFQPDPRNPKEKKKLTFATNGSSNNTIVRIDNYDYYFGDMIASRNTWVTKPPLKEVIPDRAWEASMRFGEQNVVVTQHVTLVPSQSGDLDTCLVYYTIKNESRTDHAVALRVMLDTYIGANDGVPFTVPGKKGFLDKMETFNEKQIPDFIEAVEKPEHPKNPGTTARIGLKGIRVPNVRLDDPVKMVVCRYPGDSRAGWEWGFASMDAETPKDSCVVLYWGEQRLNGKGGTRHVGFTYGLGTLEGISEPVGTANTLALALSVPGTAYKNAPFDIIGYAFYVKEGQKVKLVLPEGLTFADDESKEKTVTAADIEEIKVKGGKVTRAALTWKVKASQSGTIKGIQAESDKVKSKPATVVVKEKSIFG